jgi:hypothetical protein
VRYGGKTPAINPLSLRAIQCAFNEREDGATTGPGRWRIDLHDETTRADRRARSLDGFAMILAKPPHPRAPRALLLL